MADFISRQKKEELISQKGLVIWMSGLSGSGKTTIAIALEKALYKKKLLSKVFDGDVIRKGLNKDLSFSPAGRTENIRRIAEVSKQFVDCGIIVICGFISPVESMRKMAREIIGEQDFVEVFIDCPIEICEQRDPKGLYKKARAGEVKEFTGISAPFEKPEKPAIILKTDILTVSEAVNKIIDYIELKVKQK